MDHPARIRRAVDAMVDDGIDVMCLSIGSDFPYLTGGSFHESERLGMFILDADGHATIVVPALEAPMMPTVEGVAVIAWNETESPVTIVDTCLGDAAVVAVGSQTWTRFTLALQEQRVRRWVDAEPVMRGLRLRKDPDEIAALRASAAVVDSVVPSIADLGFTGRTERAIRRDVTELALGAGLDSVDFCIVGSGPNGASPHHDASDRTITEGDAVVIDFGGHKDGYCSDTTRNFVVGSAPDGYATAFAILHEAQQTATSFVRPGRVTAEVDRAARTIIDRAGLGERFIHRLGHGIGLDVHEAPYLVDGDTTVLEPGMAFSIEPGIYTPGSWGMRIEDIVVVTASGVDVLNNSPREYFTVQ
ncbi:MAG: aminopeptidase P family protein [Acidimicrobiia bacterium]|nr:aminopeptidase P family protein [Acidimicrobiia bacterium]